MLDNESKISTSYGNGGCKPGLHAKTLKKMLYCTANNVILTLAI
jgi:hypothetical protein